MFEAFLQAVAAFLYVNKKSDYIKKIRYSHHAYLFLNS